VRVRKSRAVQKKADIVSEQEPLHHPNSDFGVAGAELGSTALRSGECITVKPPNNRSHRVSGTRYPCDVILIKNGKISR
jgi:hypothetical protein